ncbi:MAG: heterodisulfide reductase-related iron-sulfur binding cluster [Negativicutes bacterium]|nr:heterodisulfide reductase-related iron-sulfur binding cluster [Negativicutes bacterium]
MDQKWLREREGRCVQDNPPGCTAGCPVHVDVRGMVVAVRKGDYAAGFALFHKMVPFPGIISRVCDQPCQEDCKRKEIDDPIFINALERICVDCNDKSRLPIAALAIRNKTVAVVGAGLSGLTAALELNRKGYAVVIFEATDCLGGSIREFPERKLPRQWIEDDFAVFDHIGVAIKYKTAISDQDHSGRSFASLCEGYDAVYLGVGCKEVIPLDVEFLADGEGLVTIDPLTLATRHPKVFAGGSLRLGGQCRSPIASIADGKIAANSIDRFLQNASLTANREKEGRYTTSLYTNIEGVQAESQVAVSNPINGYTKEEASLEAGRCLLCECRECVKACEYLAHYGSYPKRYVREVYNNLSIVMGIHHANKMINTCSLCGLCSEICPGKMDMSEVCRQARQRMVQRGKMPPSAHDFALRDMRFSSSDHFALARHQPGFTSSRVVFYPGCQFAASSPQAVKRMYEFLCEKIDGGVGLMLGCCGAPANWAGQEELFQETLQHTERDWRDLGRPLVITACPTCFSMFHHNLPELSVETVWTLLDRIGLPDDAGFASSPRLLTVHDSCTTRHEGQLQKSVRNILCKLGHEIEELPHSRDRTVCCGYGGLMLYANPEIAHKVIDRRIKESNRDYLTYCAMCRDNFAAQGKRTFYLSDLVFATDAEKLAKQEVPGYSERQENRVRLKRSLLREVWGDRVEEPQAEVRIAFSASVRSSMEDRMILVEDVTKVIVHAEKTGDKMEDVTSGHYIAYFRPVSVTYWVEYSPQEDGFLVHNTYSHRIEILA